VLPPWRSFHDGAAASGVFRIKCITPTGQLATQSASEGVRRLCLIAAGGGGSGGGSDTAACPGPASKKQTVSGGLGNRGQLPAMPLLKTAQGCPMMRDRTQRAIHSQLVGLVKCVGLVRGWHLPLWLPPKGFWGPSKADHRRAHQRRSALAAFYRVRRQICITFSCLALNLLLEGD
jgi:hypothetical protein